MTMFLQAAYHKASPEPLEWWFRATPATLAVAGGVLACGLALLVWNWWRTGRDRVFLSYLHLEGEPGEMKRPLLYRPTIVVEYEPPEGLRPAKIGVLLHERPSSRDFTATIVDLAVRGYLEIDEESTRPGSSWRLRRLREDGALKPFEREILRGLFEPGDTAVLNVLTFDHWLGMRRAMLRLMEDAVALGWFAGNPEHIRQRWLHIGAGVTVAGLALVPVLGGAFRLGFTALAVAACGIVLAATHRWMPRRTSMGSELLRRCLGFRMYIHEAERSRHEFNERRAIFAEYLPYAIAFGSVSRWARAVQHVNTIDPGALGLPRSPVADWLGFLSPPWTS